MNQVFGSRFGRRCLLGRCAALALTLICASSIVRAQIHQPVELQGGVIVDTQGVIDEITLHYDHDLELELTPFYADLFAVLGPDVHVRVLCRNAEEMSHFFQVWGVYITSVGRTLTLINIGMDLTIWARDRLIARESHDLEVEMPGFVPVEDISYEESKVNEIDAYFALSDFDLTPPPLDTILHIEGGNVVSNARFTFMGVNIIDENPDVQWQSRAVINHLFKVAGRPVIPVGVSEGTPPWCHVDMYLTPIDDQLLLVADVNLGAELLGLVLETGDSDQSDDESFPGISSVVPDGLDRVAQEMEDRGFAVQRLPAVADPASDWMITYNNVLLEQRDGRKRAFVPKYHLPVLDQYATSVYHSLGFDVSTIDVSQIYQMGGALRCVVNVTRRHPSRWSSSSAHGPGEIRCFDLTPPEVQDGDAELRTFDTWNTSHAFKSPDQASGDVLDLTDFRCSCGSPRH